MEPLVLACLIVAFLGCAAEAVWHRSVVAGALAFFVLAFLIPHLAAL